MALAATTLLPTNSGPSSRQCLANLARPSSRRYRPGKFEGTARRTSSPSLLAALGGPHAVVLRLPGAREPVADYARGSFWDFCLWVLEGLGQFSGEYWVSFGFKC